MQINKLSEEKRSIMDQLEDAERQLKKRDDEVARLRRENDMLRDEVRNLFRCQVHDAAYSAPELCVEQHI